MAEGNDELAALAIDDADAIALREVLSCCREIFDRAKASRAKLAEEKLRRTELESAIRKLADSLDLGSGNPHISGADEKMMRHVSERLLALVGGKAS